ncbi:MAG: ATP-binding protein [Vicinamibacteraceae bacterium]
MAREGVRSVGAVRRLARASAAILDTSLPLPDLLRVTADATRRVLRAHHARIQLSGDPTTPGDATTAVSLSKSYAVDAASEPFLDLADVAQLFTGERDILRWNQPGLAQRLPGTAPSGKRLARSLLAARLTGRDGEDIGWLQVSDKQRGQFSSSDESILRHISRVAEAALALAWYREAVQREQSAREAAEAASRLKDEFLAVLSHELRTPLNAILGWAGLVREGRVSGAGILRALEVIERNARLQKQIVQDVLETSHAVTGRLQLETQPVDLVAVISEAVNALRPTAERKEVRLIVDLDSAAGEMLGDPPRLQQIVWNLLSNAVKFTPAAGQVCVLLTRVDDRARLTVSDTGPGIAPERLPHVFEGSLQARRSTTRRDRGLGIGLAIARHLAEAHGGSIAAANRSDGPGAVFTVDLPLHAHPPPAHPALHEPRAAPARVIEARIVIADEDTDAADFLRLVLEHAGATVVRVSSIAEVRAILGDGAHDLLLVDTALLEEEASGLIPSLRAMGPDANRTLGAVALTGAPSARHREELRNQGFDDALTKPVDPTKVAALVGRVLDERCGMPQT